MEEVENNSSARPFICYNSLAEQRHTAYPEVVDARRRRVRFHVRPDQCAQESADGGVRVRGCFGFGREPTPSAFQPGRPHHCKRNTVGISIRTPEGQA